MATEDLKDKDPQVNAEEEGGEKKPEEKKGAEAKKKKTTSKPGKKKPGKGKEVEEKLKEEQDKYLRLSADFDNYRKRTLKERMDLTKFAGTEIYTSLLPVMDDFERAMNSMGDTDDINAVRQGIELIYNKFRDYLSQQGVKEIDALHKEFDTDVHDAVTKTPAPNKNLKGKVVDIIEKGYILNDRVIRYAKVVVGE